MIPTDFRGAAKRLDDLDLPRVGRTIGVGEDEIHAVLEVESRGSGFDGLGRPLILFEPHVFWRELGPGAKRTRAAAKGLAYQNWGAKPYPKDSYPRLKEAMAIDETAALRSASWGLGQVMGNNHVDAGFATVQEFVAAMCADEENHLAAMIRFIKVNRLDDEIRRHDWDGFARGYNGPGYAKNQYGIRLARAYAKWSRIKDTPFTLDMAARETAAFDQAPHVSASTPLPKVIQPAPVLPAAPQPAATAEKPSPAPIAIPAPATHQPDDPGPRTPDPKPGFWSRFAASLKSRIGA